MFKFPQAAELARTVRITNRNKNEKLAKKILTAFEKFLKIDVTVFKFSYKIPLNYLAKDICSEIKIMSNLAEDGYEVYPEYNEDEAQIIISWNNC